MVKKLGLKSW